MSIISCSLKLTQVAISVFYSFKSDMMNTFFKSLRLSIRRGFLKDLFLCYLFNVCILTQLKTAPRLMLAPIHISD